VRFVYLNYLSILGTTGASPREFGRFLATVQEGSWSPVVDSARPLADAEAGYERLAGDHYGKVVLSI
jgi:NADPH:quinone reductase-like Zn-dependent oxidoreductase